MGHRSYIPHGPGDPCEVHTFVIFDMDNAHAFKPAIAVTRKGHVEGFIELANHRLGRYAVRTDAGDYTLFETVGRVPLEVDELVWGDFCSIPGQTYRTERHGTVGVVALCCHCAHRDAAHWVHERQASAG